VDDDLDAVVERDPNAAPVPEVSQLVIGQVILPGHALTPQGRRSSKSRGLAGKRREFETVSHAVVNVNTIRDVAPRGIVVRHETDGASINNNEINRGTSKRGVQPSCLC